MTERPCPDVHELSPLLAGETLGSGLQTHIDACEDCQQRVAEMRTQVLALRSVVTSSGSPSTSNRLSSVGKYLVVGELGSGAQSVVYRAVHPTLETELAIKLSRTPLGDEADSRPLLVSEGRLLAKLEHPNLARVIDLDFHEDAPFLAMEFVRGQNLQDRSGSRPATPRESAEWTAKLARALAEIHNQGVIHQDIKPANVMIDTEGEPRLLDLGLARFRHVWDGDQPPPTGGTLAYMAPEQALGQSNRIGTHTDIFGLGGVLYFMLTGSPPYPGETVQQIREKAAKADFDKEALSRPGIPSRLRSICLKAMQPDPENRYPSARDLAEDLERYSAPRAYLYRAALGLAAVFLLAFALWWMNSGNDGNPSNPALPNTPGNSDRLADLRIEISREGKYFDLNQALPLKSTKDRVRIVGKVPKGWHAALFLLTPTGKAQRLAVDTSPADDFTRVVFPGKGSQAPFDYVEGGTEFVLLCAGPTREKLDELEKTLEAVVGTLPTLPAEVVVRLDRNEPKREARHSLGPAEADPVAKVEDRLDKLRLRLRDRIPLLRGVAFAHRP